MIGRPCHELDIKWKFSDVQILYLILHLALALPMYDLKIQAFGIKYVVL